MAEGIAGVCQNALTPAVARRAATAFAAHLFDQAGTSRPTVVFATDGRLLTAELSAATAEALRWSGCDLIDMGEATSAEVSHAMRCDGADGGLLVGNLLSESRTASFSFLGPQGRPWSLGDSLDAVRQRCDEGVTRPRRTAGSLRRRAAAPSMVPTVEGGENGGPPSAEDSPPLRIVIDTACQRLESQLGQQLAGIARLIIPQPLPLPLLTENHANAPQLTFRQRREKMVSRQIIADGADVGIWIDGLGEACTIFDDRGLPISVRQLLALLARAPYDELDATTLFCTGLNRESHWQAFFCSPAELIADDSGRIGMRLSDGFPCFDAGLVLTRLTGLLKQIDQPLRKVLG